MWKNFSMIWINHSRGLLTHISTFSSMGVSSSSGHKIITDLELMICSRLLPNARSAAPASRKGAISVITGSLPFISPRTLQLQMYSIIFLELLLFFLRACYLLPPLDQPPEHFVLMELQVCYRNRRKPVNFNLRSILDRKENLFKRHILFARPF
jgi:hypothetical protein